jgi:predicted dehydrogenase
MTRLASRLVRAGDIGAVRLVQVEYIQGGLAAKIEDGPQTTRIRWLFDPMRSGLAQVMSAIGCHAQHLACFVTGRDIARVAAEAGTVVPGRRVLDHVSALVEFSGGFKGTFTAFQAAAGAENDIRLRVYGERGMVDWSHRECSYLRLSMIGEPARVIGRGDPNLPPDILRALAPRASGGAAAGLREHLRRSRAGAHDHRHRRPAAGVRVSAHRGRRAHDGVHRGVPGVSRGRAMGRGRGRRWRRAGVVRRA